MLFSAADCDCASRNRATAPAMTPCCWRRRRRRAPAIAWSISAPASAPRVSRSPGASPASSWCWSRSIPGLRIWPAATPRRTGFWPMSSVLDVTAGRQYFAAAGLVPDSADAVLMNPPFNDAARHRASPDKAREIAPCGDCGDAGELGSRQPAHSQIRWNPHADLARRRPRRGAGRARSRLRKLADSAGSRRPGERRRFGF